MKDLEVREEIQIKNLVVKQKTEISEFQKEKRFLQKVHKIYPNCLICQEKSLKYPSKK